MTYFSVMGEGRRKRVRSPYILTKMQRMPQNVAQLQNEFSRFT